MQSSNSCISCHLGSRRKQLIGTLQLLTASVLKTQRNGGREFSDSKGDPSENSFSSLLEAPVVRKAHREAQLLTLPGQQSNPPPKIELVAG